MLNNEGCVGERNGTAIFLLFSSVGRRCASKVPANACRARRAASTTSNNLQNGHHSTCAFILQGQHEPTPEKADNNEQYHGIAIAP